MQRYTRKQIRAAFYRMFYESGEWFFPPEGGLWSRTATQAVEDELEWFFDEMLDAVPTQMIPYV